jgi:type I restriction enzyme S subunit
MVSSSSLGWLYHPSFRDEWERHQLYGLARWVNGLAFRNIQFSNHGEPVIKIAEVKNGISDQTKLTQQVFDDSVRIKSGDLIFSWSGQPETSIDVFRWRGPEGWLNQHLFRVTPEEVVYEPFFYHLLSYLRPNFVGIARNKQTTGLGHVTKRDLEAIAVGLPPFSEQRCIAEVLGALDDKIEANRRTSETAWLLAESHFHRITESDEVASVLLGDVADLSYGKSLPERSREPGTIPVYGSGGIVGYHSRALVEGPGVIVGRKGTAGAVHWCYSDFFPIDTTFFVQSERLPLEYLYFTLRSLGLNRMNFDSAVPGLNRNATLARLVPLPGPDSLDNFARMASVITSAVSVIEHESDCLVRLRDVLLPKLMSGELRVRDAEHLVEAAV